MRSTLALALAPLALACALRASAAEHLLVLDPATSHVTFTLGATGHDVDGRFAVRSGELRFDPETGSASGEIAVDATTGGTDNPKRDKTMHAKVLESAAHPLVTFKAERIDGTFAESGPSDVTIHGTINLHGAEHPLDLPAHVEIDGDHAHATARFPIPFVDWGLHDPSMLFLRVDKVVNMTVDAAGTLSRPAATPAATPAAPGGH